jgi:hypothetical protein
MGAGFAGTVSPHPKLMIAFVDRETRDKSLAANAELSSIET